MEQLAVAIKEGLHQQPEVAHAEYGVLPLLEDALFEQEEEAHHDQCHVVVPSLPLAHLVVRQPHLAHVIPAAALDPVEPGLHEDHPPHAEPSYLSVSERVLDDILARGTFPRMNVEVATPQRRSLILHSIRCRSIFSMLRLCHSSQMPDAIAISLML